MSFLRGAPDIETSVRKAISPEETAPKRKHVRACVVYTWDHKSGKAFWNAVKMLPLQNDSVMTFKALIVIHKVLHEGHKSVLRDAQHQVDWIRSLSGPIGGHGSYRRLIDEYINLLLYKLEFHRRHPDFNGTFEYEEYITLRNVDDPNEGYEAVVDLMNLQDSIDDFQRLVFASLGSVGRKSSGSGIGPMECRVSSLTAMVTESYGIYRFITSMLRGLHQQSDHEVLEPLRSRYYSQHRRLRNFYYECEGVKYLNSLISIPQLGSEPPDLFQSNDEAPQLPKRPREHKTGESLAPQDTGMTPIVPESTGNWWQGQQPNLAAQQAAEEQHLKQLEEYQQQLEAERQHQEMLTLQAQQQFEAEQAALLAQQQQQQQQYALQQQHQSQASSMEQEMAMLRSQQEEAQSMLQQYDQRVQSLEADLAQMTSLTQQQIDAKTEQIESIQSQIDTWRNKYEALAKLYSQLRHEHLDLMAKYRKVQTKAASAQEAIDKRERAERDLKAKNLELADLIRERDRARYELDKLKGAHSEEVEKLERNISILNDKVSENDRSRAADVSTLVGSHTKQINLLEAELANKERELARFANASETLRDKDDEVDILKEQLNQMEEMMANMEITPKNATPGDLNSILDAVLLAAYDQVQQALTTYDSPLESGNPNATPSYVLSLCDNSVGNLESFCDSFTQFVAESAGDSADPVSIITTASTLSGAIGDLLINVKGLSNLTNDTADSNEISDNAREVAANLCTFFSSLTSEFMAGLETEDDKLELIITNHVEILKYLQNLSVCVEGMLPKAHVLTGGSLDQQVDGAMAKLADSVASANQRLLALLNSASQYRVFDKHINEGIIAAAAAITSAIGELIKAAIECQKEIVANGREGGSAESYYKKNHRWTEGLISAARTVGNATNFLIETADSTLSGKGTPEELIVSSREVASSIAQLVAASRVKAGIMSTTQHNLEDTSKKVTTTCRSLVSQVEEMISKNRPDAKMVDYSQLSPMDFKSASLEQQVEVLKLEQDLVAARNRLFEIRKLEYVNQEDE